MNDFEWARRENDGRVYYSTTRSHSNCSDW